MNSLGRNTIRLGVPNIVMGKAREPTDPLADLVRQNIIRFREETKLSQAQAADLSGVPLDALRRYETGTTAAVPATVLKQLADVYGHATDDFYSPDPPSAKPPDQRTVYFLRTLPGVEIDSKVDAEIRAAVERANTLIRSRKHKK